MKFSKILILSVSFLLLLQSSSQSQTELRVMSYNLLNFPQGNMTNRVDTLKKIVDFYKPDLFLLQELKSEEGLELATDACNQMLQDNYQHATYLPQQSNPGTSWQLQQSLVYNTNKFSIKSEGYIQTFVRDINEYVLYLNDDQLANGADTTFLYVYVAHLKSSQGSENEDARASMAQYFVSHLNSIPSDAYVMLGGDFNVYTSSEEAYQILLDEENSVQLEDPIDMPGNWHSSSFPNKEILTQSTRSNQIFGDGAGGGLDDRFDFILISESLNDPSSNLHYTPDSYRALGNNGECYNGDILDCIPGNEVPESIVRALYYMSDHLPVVMELNTDVTVGLDELADGESAFNIHYEARENQLNIWSDMHTEQADLQIYDLNGRVIFSKQIGSLEKGQIHKIQLDDWHTGIYLVRISGKGFSNVQRIVNN